MNVLLGGFTFAALAIAAHAAHAGSCAETVGKLDSKGKQTEVVFLSRVKTSDVPDVVPCDSLASVFSSLVHGKRSGGRKLEEDRPLDPAKAQENLDQALQQSEVRSQFDELQQEPDEDLRLLYEAAVLDAEGYYDARELIIEKLRQRLGG